MHDLSFEEIGQALKSFDFPSTELVVGIATGGIVPASLVAFHLGCPLQLIKVNYRHPDNSPAYEAPVLLAQLQPRPAPGTHILLVDDVSVSGKTLDFVKKVLADYTITTLVMKGKADFVIFPEIKTCVKWPWKI